ncbi:hypothetical protein WJX81_001945 [Elliptochloris bilobata]|uniref:Uncharacterized protein n=1 Tax=Elliptochloris bilobata TaxID=381761 RepID=A0AAW1QZF3_9CHLO
MVLEEGAKLRLTADEAREELNKLEELTRARSDLAFSSAMADINREADDFEEQLRAARERLEADQAEFSAWERKTARERSAGHFFQSLYRSDSPAPAGSGSPSDEEAHTLRKQQERESAEDATRRAPVRIFVYGFLAAVLSAAILLDVVQSDSPAIGQDILYMLLALAFAARAWVERNREA